MRLAEVSSRLSDLSERYQVPERVSAASQKVHEGMSAANDAVRRGAETAYRLARENPKTSIGAAIAAAAIIGGTLWWLFGRGGEPVQRRRAHSRVRAGTERRRKQRSARAS